MAESKKAGRSVLRAVDGRKASGVCQYSADSKGFEAVVTAQVFDGAAAPEAVLQFGTDKDYRCRPPAGIESPLRCGEPGVVAVWVTEGGRPALFGQLVPGAFDAAEARKRLLGAPARQEGAKEELKTPAPLSSSAGPGGALAAQQPAEPILLLQSGPQPQQQEPLVKAASFPMQSPAAEAEKIPAGQFAPPASGPLVVRRAPRPTLRPPVYSPLWDDVSAEFEKMLDNLPPVRPFDGNMEGARFAQMPLAGAVQCYIGSVEIKGMKVFLQAVPARPFARPAGFDHSLVSREGESFWVKYFIQE
jgi:hypothetical protein